MKPTSKKSALIRKIPYLIIKDEPSDFVLVRNDDGTTREVKLFAEEKYIWRHPEGLVEKENL